MGFSRIRLHLSVPSWLLVAASLLAVPPIAGASLTHLEQVPSTRIVLILSPKHEPVINGQPVPWNQLDHQIRAIFELRPRKMLIVQADSIKDRQAIARVQQIAKRRGVTVAVEAPAAG